VSIRQTTLAWAGLRIGEASALRWRDVDLSGGTIRVRQSKTDAGIRDVDVQLELRDELVEWRAATRLAGGDDLVFPTREGTRRDRERANERLDAAGKPRLPDGLSPHALRHSFASWLIGEGEDRACVMEQIGHTDPKVTLGIYAKAIRNGRRSVRSQRRLAALSAGTVEGLDGAPLTTRASERRDDCG
jgi:integrase